MSEALLRKRSMSWLAFRAFLLGTSVAVLIFFIGWVQPSLEGRSGQSIGADSATYIHIGNDLHNHAVTAGEAIVLLHFPNNLWAPVLFVVLLRTPAFIALANCCIFLFSVSLLVRNTGVHRTFLVFLLLINPTTIVSLLTVNKEILDLLVVSLFVTGMMLRRRGLVFWAFALSAINRVELAAIMLLFLFATSRLNPLRRGRFKGFVLLLFLISLVLPLAARGDFEGRFLQAAQGGLVTLLDRLQMHFLYFAAYLPKLLENLFAELVNPSKWARYDTRDLSNSWIIFFNNFSNVIVLAILIRKRTLSLQSDVAYLALLGSAVMCLSFVIQPRYFFFMYVLLCLEAARDLPVQRYRFHLPLTVKEPA